MRKTFLNALAVSVIIAVAIYMVSEQTVTRPRHIRTPDGEVFCPYTEEQLKEYMPDMYEKHWKKKTE